jgi:glycosyltransferase involved in cell wall biosynthesis
MRDLLVIIPAYNEERSIAETVEGLKEQTDFDYLVIDDGSTDQTWQVCLKNEYRAIHFDENRGLGCVFREVILYALEHGYHAIAQFDADGQHRCVDLLKLAKLYEEEQPDVYIGVRNLKGLKKFSPRAIGSKLIRISIYLKTGVKLKDPTSGLRIFGEKAMRRYLQGEFKRPEPDMLTKWLLEGYVFHETPIIVEKRKYGESFLKGFKGFRFVIDICVTILKMPKRKQIESELRDGKNKSKFDSSGL